MLIQLGSPGTKEYYDAKDRLDRVLMAPPPEEVSRRLADGRVSTRRPPAWFAEADASTAALLAALPTPTEED